MQLILCSNFDFIENICGLLTCGFAAMRLKAARQYVVELRQEHTKMLDWMSCAAFKGCYQRLPAVHMTEFLITLLLTQGRAGPLLHLNGHMGPT